jgi:hypothetical protein
MEMTLRTLQALVESPSWEERRQLLHGAPYLMTDGGLQVAAQAGESAAARGEAEIARAIRAYAALARRCREVGVDAAVDEAHTALLLTLLEEFIDCYSWADSYRYLMSHADLRSPRAPDVLVDVAQRAQAAGNEDYAKILRTHERLLRRVAQLGAEKAFLEVGGMDFLSGMRAHLDSDS